MKKEHKREVTLWADDDWWCWSKKDLIKHLIGENNLAIFHHAKRSCYEGKPREIRVIFKEIKDSPNDH